MFILLLSSLSLISIKAGCRPPFLPAPETFLVLDFAFLTGELFVLSRGVRFCLISRGGGVLLELLELAGEGAGDGSGLTLPDLEEEDLSLAVVVCLRLVLLLAVDHHDHIGVLLD